MSFVNEAPRLALLRMLADMRDLENTRRPEMTAGAWPTHYALFPGRNEYPYPDDDMLLAAREAVLSGQAHGGPSRYGYAYMVRITDEGYDSIRAYDAIGEDAQEAHARSALSR